MKATELRIGNLVYGNMNEICIVTELGNVLNPNLVSYREVSNIKAWGQNRQKPIPLTEEWLLKFGFSTTDYKKGYIGINHKAGGIITDFVLTYPLVNGVFQKYFIWEHSKFKYQELKYVHQLQNLYFALTGEELTIKNTHND
jgi:hypothetical protein